MTACKSVKQFEPDFIMAVGGGSVMNLAKGVWSLYATKPGVIKALVKVMTEAGMNVSIVEGSAGADPNKRSAIFGSVCRTIENNS